LELPIRFVLPQESKRPKNLSRKRILVLAMSEKIHLLVALTKKSIRLFVAVQKKKLK
jgi:hypothetical protein